MTIARRKFFYDCEFMEEPGFLELISIGVVDEDGNEFYACNSDADLDRANDWVDENVIPKLPPEGSKEWMTSEKIRDGLLEFMMPSKDDPVSLYGYYSDYDHVLLCWLFGRMVDLPEGMPMFTIDLKQERERIHVVNPVHEDEHNALADARWNKRLYDTMMAEWELKSIKERNKYDAMLDKTRSEYERKLKSISHLASVLLGDIKDSRENILVGKDLFVRSVTEATGLREDVKNLQKENRRLGIEIDAMRAGEVNYKVRLNERFGAIFSEKKEKIKDLEDKIRELEDGDYRS